MNPWKRYVLGAGLAAFGLAASAGCPTCYAPPMPRSQVQWQKMGASSRISGVAGQLEKLEKAVHASRITPDVARIRLGTIRQEIAALAEDWRQGRLTDLENAALKQFTARAEELARAIEAASDAKP